MVEILISVAAKVAEYLVDPIKRQISYLCNSHHHVKDVLRKIDDLGHEREKAKELVKEAIRQGDKIYPYVQEWLQATETILQMRAALVQDEERASKSCFHLKSRYQLSKKAMRQGEDVDAKLQQARDFGGIVSYRPPPPPLISSASSTNDASFPSRQSIFNQIMEALMNEGTSIVGVWGMGGVGKTTLALQVAKRAEEEKLFDKVVMASSISQDPNISEIQTEIATTLGLTFREGQVKSVSLMNSLKNQVKILVILDDIWDKLDLRKIGIPYGEDHKGCKLLLTSREYEVVATDMKAQQVFHLPHLQAEEAWSLLMRTAGYSVEYKPELKAIADDIVSKCEGLPIAIVTVANALKNKSEGEWKNALKELKRAQPTNIRGMSKNVYSCLELSYKHLESDEVKSLFLLCGLLGGRRISKDHLLLYTTGLNLFEGMHSMEETTNKLITLVGKLIASSLLLEAEEGDNHLPRSLFFDDLFVKMHDVVRDVARSIASKNEHYQYVVSEAVELREWERQGECRNYNGISLECRDSDDLPPRLVCPELKLFLLNSSLNRRAQRRPKLRIPENFFQGVTKLRVLHMNLVCLTPSPSCLGFLSNLCTLCLIRCQLEDMIIVGEMKTLKVLSLAMSNIVELPKEMMQLKDLRVLDLKDCTSLRLIPRNVISSLSRLECLRLEGCDNILWGRDGESNNDRACLSELKDLTQLRTLEVKVSDPSLLPKDIRLELNLTRHFIMIGDKGWTRLAYKLSRNLIVGGVKSPVVLLKCFSSLFEACQLLSLTKLDGISDLVYYLDKRGFLQLECLIIDDCSAIRHIFSSFGWVPPRDTFCRLDRLDLSKLPDMESVFHFDETAPILIECFGKLRFLRLEDCKKLRSVIYLPVQHGRQLTFFPRLQKLDLGNLRDLTSFYFTTAPQDSDSEVSMSILFNQQAAFPYLEELYVCELGRHLRALWHNQFPISSFSKLKKLNVKYWYGLQKLFSVSLVKALVQLEELGIIWCKSLEEIVANEGENVEDEAAFFPKLTHLELQFLVMLKRFSSQVIKLRWPLLKELCLRECDEVRLLFKEIGLEDEVDIRPLFLLEKEAFPDLETLSILSFKGLKKIWQGQFSRVSFSKLRVLSIWGCDAISVVISSNMVQKLLNLEELTVRECGSVNEVIQLLDDESTKDEFHFNKLKKLDLYNLPNLKGFCSSTCTFRFPCLEKLILSRCDKMECFCKGGLHINNNDVKEYFLRVLPSNAEAIHKTSTGHLGARNVGSSSQTVSN